MTIEGSQVSTITRPILSAWQSIATLKDTSVVESEIAVESVIIVEEATRMLTGVRKLLPEPAVAAVTSVFAVGETSVSKESSLVGV